MELTRKLDEHKKGAWIGMMILGFILFLAGWIGNSSQFDTEWTYELLETWRTGPLA